MPVMPVYTNCAAPPLPTPRRCHEVGAFVGAFARSRPATERIAFLATGGISHWVGTPETGRINPDFDRRVLDPGRQIIVLSRARRPLRVVLDPGSCSDEHEAAKYRRGP